MEEEAKFDIKLEKNNASLLDVYYNGEKIYSKKATGPFPRGAEILAIIRKNKE